MSRRTAAAIALLTLAAGGSAAAGDGRATGFAPLPEAAGGPPPPWPGWCGHPLCRPHGPVVIYRDAAPAPAPPPPTPAQAAALVAAGRLDAAAELLATLARTAPQDPEVWTLRARLERKQQRLAAARQAAARALRIEPGHPGALAEQGLIALASGDADGARAALAALDAGCGGCPEAAALRSALTGAGHVGSGTGAKRLRVAP